MTINAYIRGVKQHGWEPFPGKFWQRNYYERIIRNERGLNTVRQYIHNNPACGENDNENLNRRAVFVCASATIFDISLALV